MPHFQPDTFQRAGLFFHTAGSHPPPAKKILRQGLEIPQKLLTLLMESHPSGNPVQRGKRTAQNRTPNPSFTFFREYRTQEMKRQTRFCRLFTVCLFVASANAITNRKLTSYKAFLHRKMRTFVQRLIHAYIRLLCCIIMKTHVLHGPTVCRSKNKK